jgi:hypothetical protein
MPRCKHERDITVLLPHFAQEFQKKDSTKQDRCVFGQLAVRDCEGFDRSVRALPLPNHVEIHLRCSSGSEDESDGLPSHGPF